MSVPPLPEPYGPEPSAAELATSRDPRMGIAYAVNVRSEGGGENSVHQVVMTYRLHRRAPDGGQLPVLQVEMRGRRLLGMIADGDLVQTPLPLPLSGVVQLETVTNLTTGATVVLKQPKAAAGCLIASLVLLSLMALIVVGGFVLFLLTSS